LAQKNQKTGRTLITQEVYFIVGGFPEVVQSWITTQQILEVKDKLSTIVQAYRDDFEKYGKRTHLLRIGEKFKFTGLEEYRKKELAPCLELMEKAHIVHMIYHSSGQGIPLGAQTDLERYKVICFDIALTEHLLGLDLKGWFLNSQLEFANKRNLVESFVGQEMMAYSSPSMRSNLYYWQRESRGSEAEVDYLTPLQGEVIPLEVKARKGSTLKSLHSFLDSHPKSLYGVKFSSMERSQFEKIKAIPLYAVFEMVEEGIDRVRGLL
jgi:predicted AAA+ superfamily ATPase